MDVVFLYLVILGIVVGIDAILQYDCFVISICEEIKLQGERALIPVALTANIPVVALLSGGNDILSDFDGNPMPPGCLLHRTGQSVYDACRHSYQLRG